VLILGGASGGHAAGEVPNTVRMAAKLGIQAAFGGVDPAACTRTRTPSSPSSIRGCRGLGGGVISIEFASVWASLQDIYGRLAVDF
jgi:hypothetical protein